MKKMSFRKMWLLLAFASLSAESQAQMSGSGTENDPYLVKTPDDLFDVRNDLSACYKMANDIDLTEWIAEENPTNGWAPINDFQGTFDGDGYTISGLYVNRPNEDDGGLFGYASSSNCEFKNVVLLDPNVTSRNYAGALGGTLYGNVTNVKVINGIIKAINTSIGTSTGVAGGIVGVWGYPNGKSLLRNKVINSKISGLTVGGVVGEVDWTEYIYDSPTTYLVSNIVSECDITGTDVGGIVGEVYAYYSYTIHVNSNYASGTLTGTEYTSGIVGYAYINMSNSSYKFTSNISNNRFDGNIVGGSSYSAGIFAYCRTKSGKTAHTVNGNIVTGTISGSSIVYGISQYSANYNVCCADMLSSTSYEPARIGYSGTNYAYNGMTVMKNGVAQTVNDGGVDGTSYSLRMLRRKSTYTALDFDFNNDWAIVEGVTLPYNKQQSTPATIENCFGGENCIVSGTATGNGTVYVFVDGKMTTGEVTNGRWSLSIGNIAVGTTVKVSVETEGMLPSIITKTSAADPSGDTTEKCATPTISYTDGVLHFDCATEGVTYHYMVTNGAIAEQIGNDNKLSSTYMVSVYAAKEGYYDSEVATKEINLAGLKGDINGDGEVTPMDASLILQYIAKKITW